MSAGYTGETRSLKLTARHHVGARSKLCKCAKHGLIGIRLHRVADERTHVGKRARKHLIVAGERCRRITIKRRSNRGGERVQIHRLGVEDAVAIGKVVHHTLS